MWVYLARPARTITNLTIVVGGIFVGLYALISGQLAKLSTGPMWVFLARLARNITNLTIVGGIFVGLYALIFGQLAKRVEAVGEFRKEYGSKIRLSIFLKRLGPVFIKFLRIT